MPRKILMLPWNCPGLTFWKVGSPSSYKEFEFWPYSAAGAGLGNHRKVLRVGNIASCASGLMLTAL